MAQICAAAGEGAALKILMAVHHFPPNYTGGAEWRTLRTAVELMKRGHQVQVVSVEKFDCEVTPGGRLSWDDDTFEEVAIRRLCLDGRSLGTYSKVEYDNPWIGEHMAHLIQEWQPDLFHLFSGYIMSGSSLQAAYEAGIPTAVTLTDFWFLCPRISFLRSDGTLSTLPIQPWVCARCLGEEKRRYRYLRKVLPWLANFYWRSHTGASDRIQERHDYLLSQLNRAGVVISPSEFLRSIYIQAGVDPRKIVFSRQGRRSPNPLQGEFEKTPSRCLRAGYLGQITPIKGVKVLVEALQYLPGADLTLRIYGDPSTFPDYTAELMPLVKQDPRIEFCGVYQSADLPSVHRDLDVVVVPSLWYENSPNVIQEAYLHRTPAIVSKLGGMIEMVEHEKGGLVFEPGNARDLSFQLKRLLDEPGLLEHLRSGIPPVKTLSEEIDELEMFYTRLLPRAPEVC